MGINDVDADNSISTFNPQVRDRVGFTDRPEVDVIGGDEKLGRLEGTKQAILERLLPQERHVLSIADELRIRESAIRRHFDQLENLELVHGFFRQEGLGRPKKYYEITAKGRRTYPGAFAQTLRSELDDRVRAGRAPSRGDAVFPLLDDAVDQYRSRISEAATPLAKARLLERVYNEAGVVVRPRPKNGRIFLDVTGDLVLRTALEQSGPMEASMRERILDHVMKRAGVDRERDEVFPGEDLVPHGAGGASAEGAA